MAFGLDDFIGITMGVLGFGASNDAAEAAERNTQAQYDYSMANYQIQLDYYDDLVGFQGQQQAFAGQQLAFAYEQKAYAEEQYSVGLANIATETAFREQEVYNTKLAAKTQFTAEADVAQLMQYGAADAMNNAVGEALRAGSGNVQDISREATKAAGAVRAKQSGITGGNSQKREMVDVYRQENRARTQIVDATKAQIIEASAARDELVNNYSLKVNESYRNLEAVMRLEAQPVPQTAGPQPIFLGVAPIGPVTPVGAEPIKGAVASSTFSSLSSGLNTGMNAYSWAQNL